MGKRIGFIIGLVFNKFSDILIEIIKKKIGK